MLFYKNFFYEFVTSDLQFGFKQHAVQLIMRIVISKENSPTDATTENFVFRAFFMHACKAYL
jgi:hypothetical protein